MRVVFFYHNFGHMASFPFERNGAAGSTNQEGKDYDVHTEGGDDPQNVLLR